MRTLALSLLTGAAVAASGCGGHASQPQGAQASAAGARTSAASSPRPTVPELTSIGQLRAQFNERPGAPKLIVLLSPTCPSCLIGASWVQQHILIDHPHARLRVIAIWEPVYEPDALDPAGARAAINPGFFSDPRAVSFWDPHEISGNWFSQQPLGGLGGYAVVWDAYYAFAPYAHWGPGVPTHLVAAGSSIIGNTDALQRSFLPLLR